MKTNASHNRHRIALAVLCATLHMAGARAAQAPTEDSLWYYEIGGAEPVSAPANPSVVSTTRAPPRWLGGSERY